MEVLQQHIEALIFCNQEPVKLGVATSATTALAVRSGARILRVHDVLENRQAADVSWAIHSA